jgi:hypothetical protein
MQAQLFGMPSDYCLKCYLQVILTTAHARLSSQVLVDCISSLISSCYPTLPLLYPTSTTNQRPQPNLNK